MPRRSDLILTAIAPLVWGSSYIVTTEMMPQGYPLTLAMLRALPAGLILLVLVRRLPQGHWWWRVFVLGALNFTVFWTCLFLAAYRLPGGVAATVGAVQPMIVILLARCILGTAIRPASVVAAGVGMAGVALLILGPEARMDMGGVIAGLGGAASMGAGTVLTRKWQPPVGLLTFTAWQLTAGGLLLVPLAVIFEPPLPQLDVLNWIGLLWLGMIGAAFAYVIWFRGVARLPPSIVSGFGFLSPLSAVVLGWVILAEALSYWQIVGGALVLAALVLGQRVGQRAGQSAGPGGPDCPPGISGVSPPDPQDISSAKKAGPVFAWIGCHSEMRKRAKPSGPSPAGSIDTPGTLSA